MFNIIAYILCYDVWFYVDPRYNFGEYWLDWAFGTLKVQSADKSRPSEAFL